MRNLKSALIFILIPGIIAVGLLGCERNKKPLANIEPEGGAPAYNFKPDVNSPPGGVERP